MTMEQIELDLVHNWLDQQAKNGNQEVFTDDTYDDYDQETDEKDAVLSEHSVPVHRKVVRSPVPPEPAERYVKEDWEDVD